MFPIAALVLMSTPSARAGCGALAASVDRVEGPAAVRTFASLVRCDPQVAEADFTRFMQRAGDSENLAALSLVAIDGEIWKPVWEMIGHISDYNARDQVAASIGAACVDHPRIVGFLQGAYFGLRDLDFQQWDDALVSCASPDFDRWLQERVEDPPPRLFDEKWDALVQALVDRRGAGALPSLGRAAVKAAGSGGPFDSLLAHMEASVAPPLGESMAPADRQALVDTLVAIAPRLPPERVRPVADRLANAGATAEAASLLPSIYPDRVQDGGGFLYAAASVEAGQCKDEKVAVIHFVLVEEPGRRYGITQDLEQPLRAFKPRLSRCTPDDGPWPEVIFPDPLATRSDAGPVLDELASQWQEKGYRVKRREERTIRLP